MNIRKTTFTATLLMLWAVSGAVGASDEAASQDATSRAPAAAATMQKPQVVVPEQKYEFTPVVDGSQVTHDYLIKNSGDGPLDITQVKTG